MDRSRLDGQRHERQLQIGKVDAGPAAYEATGLEMIGGGETVVLHEPAQTGQNFAGAAIDTIQRNRFETPMLHHDVGVIIQVGTDGGQVMLGLDADSAEVVR